MDQFFEELKRRNVFRAAGAYAVGAWVLLQVIAVISEPLGFPPWVMTLLIIVIIAGVPITVVFSWIYEWTPEGFQKQTAMDAAGYAKQRGFGRLFDFIIIGLLAVAVGLLAYDRSRLEKQILISADAPSVAVLPFANNSQRAELEYLSDGISEELLNRLAVITGLKVSARRSSFSFRETDATPQEIGEILGVETILEGSVERFAGKLKVSAQLVSTGEGAVLWAQSFEGPIGDIFAIQGHILRNVVGLLAPEAGEVTATPPIAAVTQRFGAYDFYLHGLYHLNQFIAAGETRQPELMLEIAVDYFSRAIALSPRMAVALSGRALARNWLVNFGIFAREVGRPLVLEDIEAALQLGPNLAEVNYAAGRIYWRRTPKRGLEYLNRAIEINPNMARAHAWSSQALSRLGQYGAAFEAAERAFDLDPLDSWVGAEVMNAHFFRGNANLLDEMLETTRDNQWDEAMLTAEAFFRFRLGQLERFAELERRSLEIEDYRAIWVRNARGFFGSAYLTLGMRDKAAEWMGGLYDDALHLSDGRTGEAISFLEAEWKKIEQAGGRREPFWAFRAERDISGWLLQAYAHAGRSKDIIGLYESLNLPPGLPVLPRMTRMHPPWHTVIYAWALEQAGEAEKAGELVGALLAELDDRFGQGLDIPHFHWERARLYALQGRNDEALAALETAVEKGWRRWYIGLGPVLEPVRALPGYAALQARYDADIERMRASVLAD